MWCLVLLPERLNASSATVCLRPFTALPQKAEWRWHLLGRGAWDVTAVRNSEAYSLQRFPFLARSLSSLSLPAGGWMSFSERHRSRENVSTSSLDMLHNKNVLMVAVCCLVYFSTIDPTLFLGLNRAVAFIHWHSCLCECDNIILGCGAQEKY